MMESETSVCLAIRDALAEMSHECRTRVLLLVLQATARKRRAGYRTTVEKARIRRLQEKKKCILPVTT